MGSSSPSRERETAECTSPHGHFVLQVIGEVGNHFKLGIIVANEKYNFRLVERYNQEGTSVFKHLGHAIQVLGDLFEECF